MITINYTGQFGNCMFQYVFARLLCEHNRINLNSHGLLEFESTPMTQFQESNSKRGTVTITDGTYNSYRKEFGSTLMTLQPDYDYIVDGYFQDADLFNQFPDQIRNFFKLDYPKVDIDQTIVMVRLGDFIHSCYNSEIIHYKWYQEVFKYITGQKVFTITSNNLNRSPSSKEFEEKYLKEILTSSDVILSPQPNMVAEFLGVMRYKHVVCSNSTWAWWATFLSQAQDVYTHQKYGSFGVKEVKTHGVHVNRLYNIRNVSKSIDGDFIDITQL
jgi:hypothetical protein